MIITATTFQLKHIPFSPFKNNFEIGDKVILPTNPNKWGYITELNQETGDCKIKEMPEITYLFSEKAFSQFGSNHAINVEGEEFQYTCMVREALYGDYTLNYVWEDTKIAGYANEQRIIQQGLTYG